MRTVYRRPLVKKLDQLIKQHPKFIHVLLGPRQSGKTTAVVQLMGDYKKNAVVYHSADGEIQKPASWLYEKWLEVINNPNVEMLVVDEIQKVENWSETAKLIWDEQARKKPKIFKKLLLLGSSSLAIQKGLSESLTGRFLLHKASHWNFAESEEAFGLTFEQYLTYGGYPGSYEFLNNQSLWLSYLNDSIVQTVLGKDILSLTHVKSPALFRQCFELACSYAAQEISYTKLLGQLQDKGNTDLIKHYLELFAGAYLIQTLHKYSPKKIRTRSSSPKILPMCPALYSLTKQAELSQQDMGRAFEVVVGAALCEKSGQLYYWREDNYEVDFIYVSGKKIYAMEVSFSDSHSAKGLLEFKKQNPRCETVLVTPGNYQQVLSGI